MPKKIGTCLPSFTGATDWLNNRPDTISGPLLIHFWAKSCPACKMNMPYLQTLRERYKDRGLAVIAIHMPRGEFDLDIDAVKTAAAELAITEPCAIDNDHAIGSQFEVHAWPTYFLFGTNGLLKRHAAGGFGVRLMETAIDDLFDAKEETLAQST